MPDEVAARVKDELMVPLLTSEYEWAQTAWEDYADAYGVTNGDEFFGMLYAADENYSVDGKIRIRSLMRSQTVWQGLSCTCSCLRRRSILR